MVVKETILQDLGLNRFESEVYLTIQRLGETKAGNLCKELKIPTSNIYSVLERLMEKGLLSYKLKNKVKIYQPTDPGTLKSLFEKKQQEIKTQEKQLLNLIEELKKQPKEQQSQINYQYFEGIPAVKNMAHQIYSTAQKNSEMLLLSARSESWEKINAFFIELHKIRIERNVCLKLILQKQTTDIQQKIKERKDIGLVEIKVADFNNDAEILVTNEYVAILDFSTKTKTPCGFMIKNPVFVNLFKQVYGFLWANLN